MSACWQQCEWSIEDEEIEEKSKERKGKKKMLTFSGPRQVFYAPLWLGAIGASGIVCGSNPAYSVPELVHHLSITSTKYIIAEENKLENIGEAAKQCGIPADRIFILGLFNDLRQDPTPYKSWKTLLGHGEEKWNKIDSEDEQTSTIAVLGSTSGTTGLPKAAKISHRYLVTQCTMVQRVKRGSSHEVCQILTTFVKGCS
jgi:acyl-CoA synthetase (AMP-forming)/AMP-acid ligase II